MDSTTNCKSPEEKLSEQQSKQLITHLEDHTYLYVKDIVAYVEVKFKINYTIAGMRHWLRRHNFSYKKPALVPGKADKEQQQLWPAKYEELRQGLPADETIRHDRCDSTQYNHSGRYDVERRSHHPIYSKNRRGLSDEEANTCIL